MNIAQAGYHMLMILSVVDGKYDVAEGKIIVDYLVKNYKTEIDIDSENKMLLGIPESGLAEHFKNAANSFAANSAQEQRVDFIAFAFRLIEADGSVAREENKILSSLAQSWNIDVEPLLRGGDNLVKDLQNEG